MEQVQQGITVGEKDLQNSILLTTSRLILRLAAPSDITEIIRFFRANELHFSRFTPVDPAVHLSEKHWIEQIRKNKEDCCKQTALRFFIFPRGEPGRVVGTLLFGNIIRSIFQHCSVGATIDQACEGSGFIMEALSAAMEHVFTHWGIHRIQAEFDTQNARSARVLGRMGFRTVGVITGYAEVNGTRLDNVIVSLNKDEWISLRHQTINQ